MKSNFTKKTTHSLWKNLKAGVAVLALVCLFNTNAKAQDLEFSQVLLLEVTDGSCSSCFTVPAGKVWKIETALSSVSSSSYYFYMNINGNTMAQVQTSAMNNMLLPIWLPAGTDLGFRVQYSSNYSRAAVNVIEYTVH